MISNVFFGLLAIAYSSAFIIPNEFPTILSLVYSNIPPIKIGVDNRFGFGFRLGPHADFQTILEIGPQMNTGKIAEDSPAKRDSPSQAQQASPAAEPEQDLPKESPTQIIIPVVNDPKPRKVPPKKTRSPFVDKIIFNKIPGIDNR